MPVFNFDLEDGKQPVTFSLKPEDAARFMNFMAQCNGDQQDAARYRYLRRTTTAVRNSKGERVEVTPEITAAYRAYVDESVDADFSGRPIRRRDTHPFIESEFHGLVDFAAGFQAARTAGVTVPDASASDETKETKQ